MLYACSQSSDWYVAAMFAATMFALTAIVISGGRR